MNEYLAHEAKKLLAGVPWLHRVSGLVKTLETVGRGQDATPVRIPITRDVPEELPGGKYVSMVPDSSYGGMAYFEGISFAVEGQLGQMLPVKGLLRLVVWCNLDKVETDEIGAQAEVLKALVSNKLPNCGSLNAMQLKVTGVVSSEDSRLFSRYTYDEKIRQFLMQPYFAFGIDLEISARYNVLNGPVEGFTGV